MEALQQPHNLVVERQLLGAILYHKVDFEWLLTQLSADMFYEATHRAVFEVEVNCYLKYGKVEYNLVLDLAKECKLLTKIGGENTLMDLYIFASQFASYAN
ncbi:MAG: DnaB-like helicase N-terminal domain-containing protein, partial [Bacteroidales bacterium]